MNKRQFLFATTAFGAVILSAGAVAILTANAAEPQIFTGLVPGVAAGGFDPVAYFKDGAPKDGSDAFTTDWQGAKWRFSSAENLAAFQQTPQSFAPQYGGYCAYAVSRGYTAKGEPLAWTIADGKLYLNYSEDVRETWKEDIPGNIAKANGNWPGVLQ